MSHTVFGYPQCEVARCIYYDGMTGTFKKVQSFGAGDIQLRADLIPGPDGRFRVGNTAKDKNKLTAASLALYIVTGKIVSGRRIVYSDGDRTNLRWDNIKGTMDKIASIPAPKPPEHKQVIRFEGTLVIEGNHISMEGVKL